MRHQLAEVLWLKGVEDIEEIFSRGALILRKLARKEGAELRVFFHLWPEVLHAQFIIAGNVNWPIL